VNRKITVATPTWTTIPYQTSQLRSVCIGHMGRCLAPTYKHKRRDRLVDFHSNQVRTELRKSVDHSIQSSLKTNYRVRRTTFVIALVAIAASLVVLVVNSDRLFQRADLELSAPKSVREHLLVSSYNALPSLPSWIANGELDSQNGDTLDGWFFRAPSSQFKMKPMLDSDLKNPFARINVRTKTRTGCSLQHHANDRCYSVSESTRSIYRTIASSPFGRHRKCPYRRRKF